jgi:twitching motility protein PilT
MSDSNKNKYILKYFKDNDDKESYYKTLQRYLKAGNDKGVSDYHFSAGEQVIFRIDGDVVRVNGEPLNDHEARKLIFSSMTSEQIEEYEENLDSDFAIEVKGLARYRVNVYEHHRGIGAVLRTIPSEVLTMEQLGMGDEFKTISNAPRGLVLVTGPTGSGKSTTLAAMVDYINATKKEHILTIEDPIEFVHKSKKSLMSQREVKRDTHSFGSALKAALREDPDIILVGEMRDLETIKLALSAAETGHLVMGTLHTTSAAKTIDRIVDVFPAQEKDMIRSMMAESLQAVISQVLLKKIGGGRVAAHEILIGTQAIKSMIKENKIAQIYSAMQTGMKDGMKTLETSLTGHLKDGKVTFEDAYQKANKKEEIAKHRK